jgi:hypothetical protein
MLDVTHGPPTPLGSKQARSEGIEVTAIEAQLIERLKVLPSNRVAEFVDFVECVA